MDYSDAEFNAAEGFIYQPEEVLVSGWLRELPFIPNSEPSPSSKVVLYPYEWISNPHEIIELIDLLVHRGYEIVLKKHPDLEPPSFLGIAKLHLLVIMPLSTM